MNDSPILLALVNDYEVVVRGLAEMLRPHADRVRIVDMSVGGVPESRADVVLFDTFAGRRHAIERAREMADMPTIGHVALYTWDASEQLLADARAAGVSAVLSKTDDSDRLLDDIERVYRGEHPGLDRPRRAPRTFERSELTDRETEVLALLGLGLSNQDIGRELYLGVETVRTYARQVYRKLGVRNRTQAAVRARDLGLEPRRARPDASVDARSR